jgi:ABC-type Fe3+-hydroxamate transport system substrate-binding protein
MSQTAFNDAVGVRHVPVTAPARIVCLVPSITELLFVLDLGDQIVGRTRYCIHPAGRVQAVPDVGGTKKIQQTLLKELHPTHVIVNIDENPRDLVEQIATYVSHIIVTHPLQPRDNLALYRLLGGIFRREAEAEGLCQRFEQAFNALCAAVRGWPRRQVLYLIWRKPWMTVSHATYISRTLNLVGWDTLPMVTEARYPTVEMSEALLAEADLVLFSSEPYPFKPEHLAAFAHQYNYPPDRLLLIDGEMTSWYGSRAIAGLEYVHRFAGAHAQPGPS